MNVVLLIGTPGAGKSTLGSYLSRQHRCQFLSAGEWIREQGLLSNGASKEVLRSEAAALLERTVAGKEGGLLILEYVKDIDDAYALMPILVKHGATLAQVVLVTNHTMSGRIGGLLRDGERYVNSWRRDAERNVRDRTPKWQANAGLLVEFFSSMGLLHALVPQIWGKKKMTAMLPFIASAEPSNGPLDPLLPKSLALQRLDWMVSPRLVTDRAVVDRLAHEAAHTIAGLLSLQMPVPHAVVRNEKDVKWVTSGQYKISHKCDGTRYLLIVTEDGVHYFKNRAGFVYSYPVAATLPNKTILDGELVWGSTRGYFFAFDAIVFAGQRVWGLPLEERLETMQHLDSDAALSSSAFVDKGLHRQRAPSEHAVVTVIAKRHFDTLLESTTAVPYPTDGLVFTPRSMPYVLHGLLTYKWQPTTKRACDIRGENDLVYECLHNPRAGWQPVAIRWDKTSGCNERIHFKCVAGSLLEGPEHLFCCGSTPPLPEVRGMMRRALSREQVDDALIERTLDVSSGLEIFNRTPAGKHIPCRGMVFDGDRLIAAAFESFDPVAANHPASAVFDSWKKRTKSQFEAWRARDSANASFKFDGTLIIAFVHDNAVRVCTRRRMDSEQAVWAQQWLADHAHLDAFVPGWTYAFEAVYATNTVIISYAFEGLVFLDAWSPDGMSTAPSDRPALSKRLGALLCAPSVQCSTSDLWRLLAVPPLALEGWVVENCNKRTKLVHETYKAASRLSIHPVRVWHEIRMGGSRAMMPEHFRTERLAIEAALGRAFDEEKAKLEFDFDAAATWDNEDAKAVIVPTNSNLRTVMMHVEKGANLKQSAFSAMGFDDPDALSMHYKQECYFGTLRVELMDRIRPSDSGKTRYYTPSANFTQTFSKGWKNGPGFVVPLIVSALESTGVMDHVFRSMKMETAAKAILVCKSWRQTITQDADFDARVARFLMAAQVNEGVSLMHMIDLEEDQWDRFHHRREDEGYGSY